MGPNPRLDDSIERDPHRRGVEPFVVSGKTQIGEWINRLYRRVLDLEEGLVLDPNAPAPAKYETANLPLSGSKSFGVIKGLPPLGDLKFQKDYNEWVYGVLGQMRLDVDKIDLSAYATQSWVQSWCDTYYAKKDHKHPEYGTGGGGGDVDLTGYATETWVTEQIAAIEHPEGGGDVDLSGYATEEWVTETLGDTNKAVDQNSGAISDLQEAFDTAVLAAQEGSEKLELDLQSYAKKADTYSKGEVDALIPEVPEAPDLSGYALADHTHPEYEGGGGEVDLSGYALKDHTHEDLEQSIEALRDEIDQLHGRWEAPYRFSNSGIGTWKFNGTSDPSYQKEGTPELLISKLDMEGAEHSPAEFLPGNKLSITNTDGSGGFQGEIVSASDGGPSHISVVYKTIKGEGSATGHQTIQSFAPTDKPKDNGSNESYDDSELRELIAGKADADHAHDELTENFVAKDEGGHVKLFEGEINKRLEVNGSFRMNLKDNPTSTFFTAKADTTPATSWCTYKGRISNDEDVTNKSYVDNKVQQLLGLENWWTQDQHLQCRTFFKSPNGKSTAFKVYPNDDPSAHQAFYYGKTNNPLHVATVGYVDGEVSKATAGAARAATYLTAGRRVTATPANYQELRVLDANGNNAGRWSDATKLELHFSEWEVYDVVPKTPFIQVTPSNGSGLILLGHIDSVIADVANDKLTLNLSSSPVYVSNAVVGDYTFPIQLSNTFVFR